MKEMYCTFMDENGRLLTDGVYFPWSLKPIWRLINLSSNHFNYSSLVIAKIVVYAKM